MCFKTLCNDSMNNKKILEDHQKHVHSERGEEPLENIQRLNEYRQKNRQIPLTVMIKGSLIKKSDGCKLAMNLAFICKVNLDLLLLGLPLFLIYINAGLP